MRYCALTSLSRRGGVLALFGRTESGETTAAESLAGGAPPPPTRTVIGSGARFVGDLSGEEDVVVDGRFEGTIRVAGSVQVGPSGEVQADVSARRVLVGGRVRGQIVAAERAELTSSAVVEGKVQSPKLVIAEGARLEGNVATAASEGAGPAAR